MDIKANAKNIDISKAAAAAVTLETSNKSTE